MVEIARIPVNQANASVLDSYDLIRTYWGLITFLRRRRVDAFCSWLLSGLIVARVTSEVEKATKNTKRKNC